MTRNVGIYSFDEIEVRDRGGPFEVFSTASRMNGVCDATSTGNRVHRPPAAMTADSSAWAPCAGPPAMLASSPVSIPM